MSRPSPVREPCKIGWAHFERASKALADLPDRYQGIDTKRFVKVPVSPFTPITVNFTGATAPQWWFADHEIVEGGSYTALDRQHQGAIQLVLWHAELPA